MKKILFAALALFFSVATFAQKTEYFGSKISPDGAIPVTALKAKMGKNSQIDNIKVSGDIESCCQAKGCWMKIVNGSDPSIRVTFKDYGFFVPLDSGGKKAIMEGKAYMKVTPVDELRHYAEDAGKSKKEIAKIKKPKKELVFEATGVIIQG